MNGTENITTIRNKWFRKDIFDFGKRTKKSAEWDFHDADTGAVWNFRT